MARFVQGTEIRVESGAAVALQVTQCKHRVGQTAGNVGEQFVVPLPALGALEAAAFRGCAEFGHGALRYGGQTGPPARPATPRRGPCTPPASTSSMCCTAGCARPEWPRAS